MRKTTDIRGKIAVRAYFAWLNGTTAGAETDWLAAETIEHALAERRATAARKAAETRKAKTVVKSPTIASVAKRRPAAHSATAH